MTSYVHMFFDIIYIGDMLVVVCKVIVVKPVPGSRMTAHEPCADIWASLSAYMLGKG